MHAFDKHFQPYQLDVLVKSVHMREWRRLSREEGNAGETASSRASLLPKAGELPEAALVSPCGIAGALSCTVLGGGVSRAGSMQVL